MRSPNPPSRWFSEQTLLAALLATLVTALIYTETLWEWDQVLYDLNLQAWPPPASDDVVIVAIDQYSLDRIGRWPWPRRYHAALLDRLSGYRTGPVAIDVIFSEPDPDPAADAGLVDAVRRHGNVVLPVVFEHFADSGELVELLPTAGLDEHAQLGHADMALDRDGIARSLYLQAGVDGPHWPALSLQLLRQRAPDALPVLPGLRDPDPPPAGLSGDRLLVRDHRIWLSFSGPPGSVDSVSYSDVLDGSVDPQRLRGKTVLVGFTAAGQDALPTPLARDGRPMPGVEVHANALRALDRGEWLLPLALPWQIALSVLITLLPLLLYPRLLPRWAPLIALLAAAAALLASLLLLGYARLWFAPSATLAGVVLGYVLWSWRRLQSTLRYLDQELARLHREPTPLLRPAAITPELAPVMEFIRHALPLRGCVLIQPDGRHNQRWGEPPDPVPPLRALPAAGWSRRGDGSWLRLPSDDGDWCVGLRWSDPTAPDAGQQALLDDVLKPYRRAAHGRPITPVEMLQERIQQVQRASQRLAAMRNFINASMAQMADGVLVADGLGQVLFNNPSAALYLTGDADRGLHDQKLSRLFGALEFVGRRSWQQSIGRVLLDGELAQLPARSRGGHDLLVQIAPFSDRRHLWRGLIVNFADISPLRASERRRAEMLGFLSHDLRSPLASVIALTQLAKYKPEKLTSGEITEQIHERTQAILGLVDDFLQLARADSSDEIELTEVDLVPLVEDAIEQTVPLADTRGSRISAAFACEQAWLMGSGGLLRRLFINLLSNAIKYSPNGSDIRVGVACVGGALRCAVRDNGYGIAQEHLPTLFDRFQRIHRDEHNKEHGSGLGLAFVKSVVDRHHGRIEVSSVLGHGTEFVMHFPSLDAEGEPGAQTLPADAAR